VELNFTINLEPTKPERPPTPAVPHIGDRMPDGTVYAGISPDTNKPMFTTPADAPLRMGWKKAMRYAANRDAYGHNDWRVPTISELNMIFNNRAVIGGFNLTGSSSAGWYWSSTKFGRWGAWDQRFSNGEQIADVLRPIPASVRCVR
jgi:hypothetical protein